MHGEDHVRGLWECRRDGADVALLRRVPVFGYLSEDKLRYLVGLARWRTYAAGEVVVQPPGGERESVLFVVRGAARVCGQMRGGAEMDVFFLSDGDALDFSDLSSGPAADAYCLATKNRTTMVRLPRSEVDSVAFPNPAGAELHRQARKRLVELAAVFWASRFHDALEHLELVLSELALENQDDMVWATHAEIARRMGVHREDVTKLLKVLKGRGAIDFEPHRRGIKLVDILGLRSNE